MVEWFISKRRGSITIILTFLLTAVMSLNASFLEVARYRSLELTFRELEENAAFSVLSQYDRDLLKNFGLLAVKQTVEKDQFVTYMKANLNDGLADSARSDSFLKLVEESVTLEKMYDLSQEEVLKEQIDEFMALRTPA